MGTLNTHSAAPRGRRRKDEDVPVRGARVMVVGSIHQLKDVLRGCDPESFELVDSAEEAYERWAAGPDQWSAVMTVLHPSRRWAVVQTPRAQALHVDTRAMSGFGLLHRISQESPDDVPLVAIVNGADEWGADALFGAYSAAYFYAKVLDIGSPTQPRGSELRTWAEASGDGDATVERLAQKAGASTEALQAIESHHGERGKAILIHHAVIWLLALFGMRYIPKRVTREYARLLASLDVGEGHTPPSHQVVTERIAFTFDTLAAVAEEYGMFAGFDEDLRQEFWPMLLPNPPGSFWADDKPCSLAAREFIDAASPYFVYDDVARSWVPTSASLDVAPGLRP